MCKYCEVIPVKYSPSSYVGEQMLPCARVGCQIYYSKGAGYSLYVVGETEEWSSKISYCPFCGRKLENKNYVRIIDILDKVNPEHRVRFVGWSSDFIENETWPSVLEFGVYKTFTDANGIVNVILTEGDDVTWDAGCLQLFYKDWIKDANDIKFFFNDCEVIPSFGDVGNSDKITQINFEPKTNNMNRNGLEE